MLSISDQDDDDDNLTMEEGQQEIFQQPYDRQRFLAGLIQAEREQQQTDAALTEGLQYIKATAILAEKYGLPSNTIDECLLFADKIVNAQCDDELLRDNIKRLKKVVEQMDDERLLHDAQWLPSKQLDLMAHHHHADIDAKKHQKLKKFKREVWVQTHPAEPFPEDNDEDADIVEMGGNSEGEYNCPLTGNLVVEPLKSKLCGHRYSKAAIEQYFMLKKSQGAPAICPVQGCKQVVSPDVLEHDVEGAFWVKRRREASGNNSKSSRSKDAMIDFTQT